MTRALGVSAILKCPTCLYEEHTTVSAGTGIKPGQVIWQEGPLPGDVLRGP